MSEYLQKISLGKGLKTLGDSGAGGNVGIFSKDVEENKKKLNSFKRFIFIVFTGEQD